MNEPRPSRRLLARTGRLARKPDREVPDEIDAREPDELWAPLDTDEIKTDDSPDGD